MGFTPEASPNLAAEDDAQNRVNCGPSDNFAMAYHPDEWAMDVRGRLRPTIVQLSKAPGVGPVGARGDFRAAKAWYESQGYVVLPHNLLGATDYVAPYRNKKGALVHRTIFQVGYNDATGTTKWSFDQEAYDAFIELLRKRGIVQQPKPQIIVGLIEQTKSILENKRQPRVDDAEKIERYNEQVAILRKQLTTLEAELVESYKVHGHPASQGRSSILRLLEGVPDAPAEDAPAEDKPRRRGFRPESRPKPVVDGEPEDNS